MYVNDYLVDGGYWINKANKSAVMNASPIKTICFDCETTGVEPDDKDEILSLAIVDGNGTVLFNELVRPEHRRKWTDAERIHGITPSMVRGKPYLADYRERLSEIFGSAELIVGYNLSFDLAFISNAHISINPRAVLFDVMMEFSPLVGERLSWKDGFKWQKLSDCAAHYGNASFSVLAHDALADATETLRCFHCLLADDAYLSQSKKSAIIGRTLSAQAAPIDKTGRRKKAWPMWLGCAFFALGAFYSIGSENGASTFLFGIVIAAVFAYLGWRRRRD